MSRRVLTLADDETRTEAQLVVERLDGEPPRIVEVHLRSLDGRGLVAEDLLVLEEMGLRMPAPRKPVDAAPVAAVEPAPVKKAAAKPPVKAPTKKTAAAKGPRQYRPSPAVEELLRVWQEVGQNQSALARRYQVPRHTAQSWVERWRAKGYQFEPPRPAAGAVESVDTNVQEG